jgi:hypothetical protein
MAPKLVDGGEYCMGAWERHTTGFGSRMLAKMGYSRGHGMRADGSGLVKPIEIEVPHVDCGHSIVSPYTLHPISYAVDFYTFNTHHS